MFELRVLTVAVLFAVLAACGGTESGSDAGSEAEASAQTGVGATGAQGASGMEGMPGMTGMQGMPEAAAIEAGGPMEQLQVHMQMMMGASPDGMLAMMPEHRQMAANMLARMNREMQQMNMPGDSAWDATADSVRQDLINMPRMSAEEVQAFMRAHSERMTRLTEMHRSMMGNPGG